MPDRISEESRKLFASDSKVGLIAVTDDAGYPHITMISTLTAKDESTVIFGQFCEGMSKQIIRKRSKAGFLLMSVEKTLWRGRAQYTHTATTGPEFDLMNSKPLFRYNNYFGIAQVHYLDLVDITDKETLEMGMIIRGALFARLMKGRVRGQANGALNRISRGLASGLTTLKFIAAEDQDGFCRITPIVQATTSTDGRIVFAGKPYADEIGMISPGQKVAIFAMNLALESVLTQGVYRGIQHGLGVVDVEMVYNPLLPVSGYIYPRTPLQAVTEFI
jgi:hypothetical protein